VLDLGRPNPVLDLGRPNPVMDLGRPNPVMDLGRPNPVMDLGCRNLKLFFLTPVVLFIMTLVYHCLFLEKVSFSFFSATKTNNFR